MDENKNLGKGDKKENEKLIELEIKTKSIKDLGQK